MGAWTIYRVFLVTDEAQTALEGCWGCPQLLEDGPHVECGWLQRLLVVLPPRPSRRLVMQRVEGSERGPISPSQRLYYLLYKGQSNDSSCPKPDRATQRSSLNEIAVSKWWRRELTRRSCLDEIWLWYPCWCWARPVYIAGRVQPGPGDQAVLNYDWPLVLEAVDAASMREAGDASPGYSSRIWVADWMQARFQLHPDDDDDASVVSGVLFCGEAYRVLLREGDSHGWLSLEGWGLGPLPSWDSFPKVVASQQ